MSRFGEYEGDEDYPNQWALWEKRAQLALEGRRGRRALAELRDALLALPEKRLIAGALCTVGLEDRIAAMPEMVENTNLRLGDALRPETYPNPDRSDLIVFAADHRGEPEGVCAMGAYIWYRRVKDGMDPAEAFASLPVVPDTSYSSANETARLGRDELGLAYALAWTIAEQNDGEYGFGELTPEERFTAFIEWIDGQLARPLLTRPPARPKKVRRQAPVPVVDDRQMELSF